MTARDGSPASDLDRVAHEAVTKGVVITIRTPDGTVYTIAPAANAGHGDPFDMVEMKI